MKRAFISFDYDHDEDLRNLLVGQARNPDSPFQIADWSVKEPFPGNWQEKVRQRIRQTDLTIVICGRFTNQASGVATEVALSRTEGKPFFLLWGRSGQLCTTPSNAPNETIYKWTWDNLKALIAGSR